MPKYAVTIPDWSEGMPLRIADIEATDRDAAEARVVAWVNRLAGEHYCDRLPEGTRIVEQSERSCPGPDDSR